jgi:hypothetical protein
VGFDPQDAVSAQAKSRIVNLFAVRMLSMGREGRERKGAGRQFRLGPPLADSMMAEASLSTQGV